jgi:hypothetical protein
MPRKSNGTCDLRHSEIMAPGVYRDAHGGLPPNMGHGGGVAAMVEKGQSTKSLRDSGEGWPVLSIIHMSEVVGSGGSCLS